MAALEHRYVYPFASSLVETGDALDLRLAVTRKTGEEPVFFTGEFKRPALAARLLRTLSQVVMTRFYTPPAMLQKILAQADPVITAGRGCLRLEGFSSCCSVYARVDFDEQALDNAELSPGTTNVDFGPDRRAALGRIREDAGLKLTVGAKEARVESGPDTVVEKKVRLPLRWLKGLAEAQSLMAGMERRFSVGRVAAVRLLRDVPRTPTRHRLWAVPAANGLRLSAREASGGVSVAGAERLRLLEGLAPMSTELRCHSGEDGGASAWVLELEGARFTLALSADRWRGFSGEGQLLSSLAGEDDPALDKVRAALNWRGDLTPGGLAEELGETPERAEGALAALASRGVVGYDVDAGCYFHRVLPFDMELVEKIHPRLKDARRLVDEGRVSIIEDGEEIVAEIASTDATYRAVIGAESSSCNCPWHAKHSGERGPCKHVLAAEIMLERDA